MPLFLLGVLLLSWLFWAGDYTHPRHSRIGAWTLETHEDKFADQLKCSLTRHDVEYTRQALVIRLSPHTDTSDAIYRVDGAPPISVKSDAMELARLGFALHDDDLRNPSGGWVRIPAEHIMTAQIIAIEAGRFKPKTRVKVEGLASALAAARTAGCTPEDFN